VPFNPLKDVAFHALARAYALGYLVSGAAALAAGLLAISALGRRPRPAPDDAEPAARAMHTSGTRSASG
jgi:hypothetical protein